MTFGPTPSMTTSAWPSRRDITPVSRSMTTRCSALENRSIRLTSSLPRTTSPARLRASPSIPAPAPVEDLAEHPRPLRRVEVHRSDQPVDLAVDVLRHPRHGGELHAVGLL